MPLRALYGLIVSILISIAVAALAGCSQTSTEAKSPLRPAPMVDFISQFGVRGGGPGQLSEPVSIATDLLGNVYIADAGSQFIHKFDWQGTPLLSFTEDALKHPQWIAVDNDGDIYVSDTVRASVFVIYPGGEKDIHRELHLKTRPGKEGFVSVAAGSDDSVYVLNSGSGKLDTDSPRSRLTQSWEPVAGTGDAGRHWGPVVMGPDGNLYIFDEHGSRIMRFTDGGQLVSEVKLAAGGTGGRVRSQFAGSKTSIFA